MVATGFQSQVGHVYTHIVRMYCLSFKNALLANVTMVIPICYSLDTIRFNVI